MTNRNFNALKERLNSVEQELTKLLRQSGSRKGGMNDEAEEQLEELQTEKMELMRKIAQAEDNSSLDD